MKRKVTNTFVLKTNALAQCKFVIFIVVVVVVVFVVIFAVVDLIIVDNDGGGGDHRALILFFSKGTNRIPNDVKMDMISHTKHFFLIFAESL